MPIYGNTCSTNYHIFCCDINTCTFLSRSKLSIFDKQVNDVWFTDLFGNGTNFHTFQLKLKSYSWTSYNTHRITSLLISHSTVVAVLVILFLNMAVSSPQWVLVKHAVPFNTFSFLNSLHNKIHCLFKLWNFLWNTSNSYFYNLKWAYTN